MVNIKSPELDLLFYALSDPTRRQILKILNEGSRTITELANPFKISLAAISKHIKILEKANLLERKVSGRIHECTINPKALQSAEECIHFYTQFWNNNLDLFTAELEAENHSQKRRK
jgi:DNA-binding transcriptional ArsR family regulator